MANPWFKFYGGEYLADQKVLVLDANERSAWVTLLCYASQNNGDIKFLNEETLLTQSGIKTELVKNYIGILKKFEQLEMVTLSNEIVTVRNWHKRQMSEAYERVKRFRAKQESNALITTDKIREEKNRKEKNRIDTATALRANLFNNPIMQTLKKAFPDRNYDLEFDLMVDWWQANKKKLPQNISAFKNWLANTKANKSVRIIREQK